MTGIYDRINAALATLGKRKERADDERQGEDARTSADTPVPTSRGRTSSPPQKQIHKLDFRPESQEDLHRRLETYK
eukprot:118310-Chlamydomonas_euryale.AAC.5